MNRASHVREVNVISRCGKIACVGESGPKYALPLIAVNCVPNSTAPDTIHEEDYAIWSEWNAPEHSCRVSSPVVIRTPVNVPVNKWALAAGDKEAPRIESKTPRPTIVQSG
ncbi:MAG: hypothetical protein HC888_02700 [Candidatus Competibacteraceae bacterium]|nr:hypothetical protein [Candidatus Competibacteraceae bacterium]